MVTAETLNFDVLQIIFAYLSVPDLASVSQVNRSFLAGALPRLYRSLGFYINQAKRYPRIVTPFAVVRARPDLAAHVQNIDIRVIPNTRVSDFLNSFTCTVGSVLPSLLPFIRSKPRLRTLRIEARLTGEQTGLLCQLRGLHSLTLENASSTVMDALPKWAESLRSTLEHLTLHTSPYLNRAVLQSTVQHLPRLRGFYVVGCRRVTHVDILAVTGYTPSLESLALTVWDTDFASNLPRICLTTLKHLAVELVPSRLLSDADRMDLPKSLISSLLSLTRSTHLASLALRLLSERQQFPTFLIDEIMEMHGPHLRGVRFMGLTVSPQGLESLVRCDRLEKLAISIPIGDIHNFASVLAASTSLHTLVDVVNHGTYGKRMSLTTDRVTPILEGVSSLTRVVSENRLWTPIDTVWSRDTTRIDEEFAGNWLLVYTASREWVSVNDAAWPRPTSYHLILELTILREVLHCASQRGSFILLELAAMMLSTAPQAQPSGEGTGAYLLLSYYAPRNTCSTSMNTCSRVSSSV